MPEHLPQSSIVPQGVPPARSASGSSGTGHRERPEHICIIGPGQMGMVCAGMLAAADASEKTSGASGRRSVVLWGHTPGEVRSLDQARTSPRLPGFVLPEGVVVTGDDGAVAGCGLVVSAVPVQFMREVWGRLAPHMNPSVGVVSVSKGIERGTLLRPTQIIADALTRGGAESADGPSRSYAALSGPTIASELAKRMPAAMVAASADEAFARTVQALFGSSWLRVYTHPDLLGVELAGAVKNVIAIAAGICDGLRAGNNAKSALLARGLAEATRLGTAMGASPHTFFGIAGVGDLATTCFSPEGRNRSCGEALGRGERLKDYLATSPFVVEGVETTRGVLELALRHKVDMPITSAVHEVLFGQKDPIDAISTLMSRGQRSEWDGG